MGRVLREVDEKEILHPHPERRVPVMQKGYSGA
jgi:hypothetical protein